MSRMLKPAAAGLAISSLCLSFVAEIPAQTQGKNKAAVKQVQAVDDGPAKSGPGPGSGAKGKTQSPPAGKSEQPTRPPVKALEVEKIDPVLDQVLEDWERNTSQFKKLSG